MSVDLKVDIDLGYVVRLNSGEFIEADVFIPHFGSDKGMLIVSDHNVIKNIQDELVNKGYGYSVIDHPLPNEKYCREDMIEMLSDWGWTGSKSSCPSWVEENTP